MIKNSIYKIFILSSIFFILFSISANAHEAKKENLPRRSLLLPRLGIANEDVMAGEQMISVIGLKNNDVRDMEHAKVTIIINDLGVRKRVGPFDLPRGQDATKTVYLELPDDVKPGIYDVTYIITGSDSVRRVKHREIRIIG